MFLRFDGLTARGEFWSVSYIMWTVFSCVIPSRCRIPKNSCLMNKPTPVPFIKIGRILILLANFNKVFWKIEHADLISDRINFGVDCIRITAIVLIYPLEFFASVGG